MVGDYIQKKSKSDEAQSGKTTANSNNGPYQTVTGLFIAGVAMLVTGFCWDMIFPINKKIWTSSFTVYTSGLATITIATMIYMIEIKNPERSGQVVKGGLARFFDVFGKNALFVFALSAFLPKGLSLIRITNGLNAKGEINYINPWNWLYQKVLVNIPGDPKLGSLLYALCVITFMWAICYWMDKKKIYIKV
jgi:predicted acyltransferase